MTGQEKTFSPTDLLNYIEVVIKETRQLEAKVMSQSNYGWLKSRHLLNQQAIGELEDIKPSILKLSPESCTSIAVKLEVLTEHITSTTLILPILKNLLREEDSTIAMAKNVKRKKETPRPHKVYPALNGRKATVSFVSQD